MTTPTKWASCLCGVRSPTTTPNGHIRALRDELQVAAMRHREMREQQRLAGEALVGAGRELLDGAS